MLDEVRRGVPVQASSGDASEYALWFNLSKDLLAVIDHDGRSQRLSESWVSTLGYPMGTLMAGRFGQFVHPDDRDVTYECFRVLVEEGIETVGFVNRYLHADGSTRWIEWSGHHLGEHGVLYGVGRDVTDSRQRRAQTTAWNAALLAVLAARSQDDVLAAVTGQARVLVGAREAETTLTLTRSRPTATAVSAASASELTTEVAIEQVTQWSARVTSSNQPLRNPRWIGVPLRDHNGHNLGLIQVSDRMDSAAFDEADEYWLTEFARVAGLAVERSEVQRRAGVELEQQQLVVALGQAALSSTALGEVLQNAVSSVASLLGVSTVAVVEVSIDSDGVTVGPLCAVPAGMTRATFTHEQYASSTAAAALRTGQPAAEEDYASTANALGKEVRAKYGLRSAVSVPMPNAGDFFGVLYAADAQPLRFGHREIAFLQQVANVLSAAMAGAATQRRILHQANHDALTGLPNRGVLRSALEASVAAALARSGSTGLLLLDLDGFKDVNDTLGHAAGDLVLEQLAVRMPAAAGQEAVVARLGGDEFAVCFIGEVSRQQLEHTAQRLTAALADPFDADGLDIALSASIGIVVTPDHGGDASTLLRHADVAMYRAKSQRSGWAVYDHALDHARAVRLTSITQLREAIRGGQLEVHYQPIVELATMRVCEVEALVRWRHATRGLVQPAEFIALAEQSGLIGELTVCVIDRAVADLAEWRHAGWPLRCAVNLSVESLTHDASTQHLVERIVAHRDILSIEITESALADTRARRTLRDLAAAGVACAIDDFGTGYSSLAALKSLPVSTVKIDREFVRELDSSAQDYAIIRSVAQLAEALSLGVIAEGVETSGTAERLAEAGVQLAQGYYFARPMPASDLKDWLRAHPMTPAPA